MNFDANPFSGYEHKAAARQEDLGGDFKLEQLGEPQELEVCFGRSDQGAASAAFPPPWPQLQLNPLKPTFRTNTQHKAAAEAAADPTVPSLLEEEEEGAAEPEDPSTKLLRNVLA